VLVAEVHHDGRHALGPEYSAQAIPVVHDPIVLCEHFDRRGLRRCRERARCKMASGCDAARLHNPEYALINDWIVDFVNNDVLKVESKRHWGDWTCRAQTVRTSLRLPPKV
jgi:hypothetical protein